jgi:hypothetical protein
MSSALRSPLAEQVPNFIACHRRQGRMNLGERASLSGHDPHETSLTTSHVRNAAMPSL